MSGSISSDTAEPNLTPILDMVFQLITFFMLVTNFKSAEMDLSLKLPVVGSAAPAPSGPEEQLLVLNIDPKGVVRQAGAVKSDLKAYLKNEAQGTIMTANQRGHSLKYGDDLPSVIVIRADRATPFKHVNNVIENCQNNGYRNFALKTMDREAAKAEQKSAEKK